MVKSKMATVVGDVTGLQQRHHPLKIKLVCWVDQRLSTDGKIVLKYCKLSWSKTLGPRVHPVKLIWIICFSLLLYSRGEKTEKELLRLWWWWWWWLSSILQLLQCNFFLPNYNFPVKVGYTRKGAIMCTTIQPVSRE